MNKLQKSTVAILGLAAVAITQDGLAQGRAEAYPTKPIRLIVPFPPGGGNDILARVVGGKMTEQLGQQVLIDNRGGGGAIIGAEISSKANPDGYTLFFGGTASLAINPSLHKKLPYDPIKSFSPISLVGTAPDILVVNPTLPVKNVKELIDMAKLKPGQLGLASSGIGTPPHLAGELFKSMAGVNMMQVHYRGGGPGYVGLLAGEVTTCFCGIASAMPFIKDGKLRSIAVTSPKRTPIMPDVPTVGESGLPGYEVVGFYSIVAPLGVPAPVVNRLNAVIRGVLALPDIKNRFFALGAEPRGSAPAELNVFTEGEIQKKAKIIKISGIKPE